MNIKLNLKRTVHHGRKAYIPGFVPVPRIILIILNILAIKYIIIPYG